MKREGKIIIGIILIFILVILEVSFIYNRYFEYDEYDVEYESGYTIIDGKEYPFCPDIPRYNAKQSEKEIKKMPRPKISLENIEGGNVCIRLENIDKYDLPLYEFEIEYDQNRGMEEYGLEYLSVKEGSNEAVLSDLEVGKTYYIRVRCNLASIHTKWSWKKKIKIEK